MKTLRFLFWLTLASITLASLLPQFFPQRVQVRPEFSFRLDYILHFISYLLLGFFLTGWKCCNNKSYKIIVFVFIFGIFFSFIFETIQYFLPTRTFNPYDMLFNFGGFVIGFLVGISYVTFKKKNKDNSPLERGGSALRNRGV